MIGVLSFGSRFLASADPDIYYYVVVPIKKRQVLIWLSVRQLVFG